MIKELSTWLRAQPGNVSPGGGVALIAEYEAFEKALPAICLKRKTRTDELSFLDFNEILIEYAAALRASPTMVSTTGS